MFNRIKTPQEMEYMRESGRMLAVVLGKLKSETAEGITPRELAAIAAKELQALGGQPAFKGYEGYPDVVCISVNNQVQHGVPSSDALKKGDIINYDFGVIYKGMITDAGITIGVGAVNEHAKRLLRGCQEALAAGLATIRDGSKVGDISAAIEKVLKSYHLGVVRELVGHGVGHQVHEKPNIPNYGRAGTGAVLRSGMTLAIEPIATLGSEQILSDPDGWTLWTADGSWSAQFEHTVAVTDDGMEILTKV